MSRLLLWIIRVRFFWGFLGDGVEYLLEVFSLGGKEFGYVFVNRYLLLRVVLGVLILVFYICFE